MDKWWNSYIDRETGGGGGGGGGDFTKKQNKVI